ncbi:MAG: dTDP-4-dehydrorhamnose 3,5-epimerase [Candidatus Hydrogenedentes bacterium]|nr:dTDP-4-dehydrorhamnose 3,5-epimerase [Candidatus Hydrogenedentota bacterium]
MPVTISQTEIPDVLLIESPVFKDERGFFTEVHSEREWKKAGLDLRFVQDNVSLSARGTLRGLHYQLEPQGQGKFVRVTTGAVFDVAVDLRRGSPTFGKWVGRTLSGENCLAMWIPSGFAHGFVALEDRTYVYYKCTAFWTPELERSLAYDDPAIGIEWPIPATLISPKDARAPRLDSAEYNFEYAK